MIKVPDDLNNKVSYVIRKKRFHLVEYISTHQIEKSEVVMCEFAIVYIVQGKKEISVDGTLREISKNQLFLLPKGKYVMSEYLPEEGEFKSMMIFLNNSLILDVIKTIGNEFLKNRSEINDSIYILNGTERIRQFYQSIEGIDWGTNHWFGKELLDIKIKELIYILLSDPSTGKNVLSFLQRISTIEKRSIEQVMNENLFSKVSLASLAAQCNMSLSSFKREFAKVFHASPIQWIIDKRLEKALVLIKNTNKPITDICYECGFENYVHFARRFKNKFGRSATDFRAEWKSY